MNKIHDGSLDDGLPEIDEKFWRNAILQRAYYRPKVSFDKYRWALRFGQMARKRHGGDADFAEVMDELAAAWKDHGGPSGLSWEEASAAVHDSWDHHGTIQGEATASQAGFKSPPTFCEHGSHVPRNIDEPNS